MIGDAVATILWHTDDGGPMHRAGRIGIRVDAQRGTATILSSQRGETHEHTLDRDECRALLDMMSAAVQDVRREGE